MENQEAYQKAKKRVKEKVGFFIHLFVYIVVNVVLIIINLSSSSPGIWFIWPLVGWGIGILFHGLGVFVFSGKSIVTEQMIEKEMKKEASTKE